LKDNSLLEDYAKKLQPVSEAELLNVSQHLSRTSAAEKVKVSESLHLAFSMVFYVNLGSWPEVGQ